MEQKRKSTQGQSGSDCEATFSDLLKSRDKKAQEMEEFHEEYGTKINKINEPDKTNKTLWDFILNDIEKVVAPDMARVRDFKRFQRKKTAKIASNAVQKRHKIVDERLKAKQKVKKELGKLIAKKVYKEYWQTTFKIHRFGILQQSKQREKEDQRKRLDNLLRNQLKLSSLLAEVLVPINSVMPVEEFTDTDAPTTVEDSLLGKRKPTKFEGVVIELKKHRRKGYAFSKVYFNERLLLEKPTKASNKINPGSILPPILLNGNLRSYQFVGLKWLLSLHEKNLNGILADEMGLGKTIQTIALLSYLAGEMGIWGPHLVIVPTTLLMNWEMEFKRWAPGMKIFTYFGRLSERKEKRKGWSQLNSFQVCITSYKIATLESKVFRRRKWYYMILDEAQQIKNSNSQTWQCLANFQTVRRLLLTGTPLQNNLIELWSLLAFLIPERFESHSDFKEWFSEPLQRALQNNQIVNKEIIENLHNILRPILLRRLKKDVEKELPKKTEVIIKVPLSMRQKYLYDEFISQDIKKSNNNDFLNLMNLLMHLRKTCNHPDLVQAKDVESGLTMRGVSLFFPSVFLLESRNSQSEMLSTLSPCEIKRVGDLLPKAKNVKNWLIKQESLLEKRMNQFNYEIVMGYHKDRQTRFVDRIGRYRRRHNLVIPTLAHYLLSAVKVKSKEESVQMLLYKLGEPTFQQRIIRFFGDNEEFLIYFHSVVSTSPSIHYTPYCSRMNLFPDYFEEHKAQFRAVVEPFNKVRLRNLFQFPRQKNIIYDSGKLNMLIHILRDLRQKGHKCLIFTQVAAL